MAKPKAVKKASAPIKTMEDFHARFGRVDVRNRSENAKQWSVGSLNADKALSGGIPKGRMVEFYGPPGGGKTTLAIKTGSLILADGGTVAYIDLERGLDLRNADLQEIVLTGKETKQEAKARKSERASWLRTNGIDPLHENFHIYEPVSGEEMFALLAAAVQNNLFDLIIVDSVPAIMPMRVLEGEPGDASFGARAKLIAEELPRILRLYDNNLVTTIIFINQVRENIGAQIKSQKSTSGYALEHYMRCKVKIQRISRSAQGDDVVSEVRIKVEKNIYGPANEARIQISAMRGIDTLAELLEVARETGYVQQSGNWHYFFEEPIEADVFSKAHKKKTLASVPGYLVGMNGEASALVWMRENGWEEKLRPVAKAIFA